MAIDGASIMIDATASPTPTGGTQYSISADGKPQGSKITAHFDHETDFLSRTTFEFSVKGPVENVSSPGGYTQVKQTVYVKWPITLANGNRTHNTGSFVFSRDPETSVADALSERIMVAQIIGSSAFANLFATNNLS